MFSPGEVILICVAGKKQKWVLSVVWWKKIENDRNQFE